MRTNEYRQQIIRVLERNHLLRIADIQKKLEKVDFSTVYRNVNQLCDDGVVKKVVFDKGVVMYELTDQPDRHDHFVCNACGDISNVAIDKQQITSQLHGVVLSDVVVSGICRTCRS
ncbi:MAG: transcriptional repressor [Candidatus Paceibacterota bacterium]